MGAVKVVVLGGSGVATPELVNAIVSSPGRTRPIKLVLVGRSLEKLEKVAAVARHMAGDDAPGDAGAPEHTGGLLSVSHTTDAQVALSGADYVINQIRVGGLEARAFDETFPQELGLPGEETVGPGGFANASRTIPVVLEYARTMERVCPAATLLTFANPSSLVQYAITRYTQVHTIGLCDSPISLINSIAAALDAPADELTVDYVGMHHFGWVTGVWWRGRNVLLEALAKAADVARDVEPAITQAIGAIPGAYLNYVFHPDRMLARKKGKRPRAEELIELQDEILAEYERPLAARKPAALVRRKAHWYAAIVAPVLLALVESGGPMVRWSDVPIGPHRPPSAPIGVHRLRLPAYSPLHTERRQRPHDLLVAARGRGGGPHPAGRWPRAPSGHRPCTAGRSGACPGELHLRDAGRGSHRGAGSGQGPACAAREPDRPYLRPGGGCAGTSVGGRTVNGGWRMEDGVLRFAICAWRLDGGFGTRQWTAVDA